jgi:hypothetical protein
LTLRAQFARQNATVNDTESKQNLNYNPTKYYITNFNPPIDYLGINAKKYQEFKMSKKEA